MRVVDNNKKFYWLGEKKKEATYDLWKEVFKGENDSFLDYYYKYKMPQNDVAGIFIEDKPISMIHLNPYIFNLNGKRMETYYVVAVGTSQEYRMQHLMDFNMRQVFSKCYKENIPFIFLRPVNKALYKKYQFKNIYSQKKLILETDVWRNIFKEYLINNDDKIKILQDFKGNKPNKLLTLDDLTIKHNLTIEDKKNLSDFSYHIINDNYNGYIFRTRAYYNNLYTQYRSDNGGVTLIYRNYRPVASYEYKRFPRHIEIVELIIKKGYEDIVLEQIFDYFFMDNKKIVFRAPIFNTNGVNVKVNLDEYIRTDEHVMGRIINLNAFVKRIKTKNTIEMIVKIKDNYIKENNGIFRIRTNTNGGEAEKYTGIKEPDITMKIEDLIDFYFKNYKLYINEIV